MKRAMGELGWTERETLATTLDAVWLALEGRQSMLRAIFGGGETDTSRPDVNHRPFDVGVFDALFGGTNK